MLSTAQICHGPTKDTMRHVKASQMVGILRETLGGGLLRLGPRLMLSLRCLGRRKVGSDPAEDVIARSDGIVRVRLDARVLIGLHEKSDGVSALGRQALGRRGHAHTVEVGQEAAPGPPTEHVSDVDGDASSYRVNSYPAVIAAGARVGGTLEAFVTWPLKEERHAAPVRVRCRAPQLGCVWLGWRGRRIV
jgi:hypothetical protein